MLDLSMTIWLALGIGLLLSGLVFALKVGLWIWIATRFFGRPPRQYESYPTMRSGSVADGLKKWLSIIATTLGIISTTVGLMKGCEDDRKEEPGHLILPYQPERIPQPELGYRCCTPQLTCNMMTGGMPVGSVCTCLTIFGGVSGRVCP